jgi:hypothetical protein
MRKTTDPNNPYQIRGFPGYRIRPNRCGLDPMDTYAEQYFMLGIFLRNLFTLKLRTKNPFYLVLMLLFGFVPFVMFLIAILDSLIFSVSFEWIILLLLIFLVLVPVLLTIHLHPRGTFFRFLLNFEPKTENPLSSNFMLLLPIIIIVMLRLFLYYVDYDWFFLLILAPSLLVTTMLTINLFLSILDIVRSKRIGR